MGCLPESRVLLRGTCLPAPQAALLNASMGQIGGVKALGEPAVNRGEEVVSFGVPALIAAEPGEAHGPRAIPRAWLPAPSRC